jgi:dihydrofolate synthase/folylpolyglutamate synthase
MNNRYQNALDWLYQFANFEHKRIDQYSPDKIDPTRPSRLLALLDNPHQQYPAVHIAGTKGKGSVAAMCAFALRAAGLRVGLYTSPHLVEFRERFRILTPDDADGRISPDQFADLVAELQPAAAQIPGITWFELVTAVAFLYFARQQVDVAVIEVGLGGRLDATNIITPLVAVITSLSLDHTDLLGDTLSAIAYEKGGIIKPGVPVVVAPQKREALDRLQAIAAERDAPLTAVGETWRWETISDSDRRRPTVDRPTGDDSPSAVGGRRSNLRITRPISLDLRLPLSGEHQRENGVTAVAALKTIQPHFPTLTDAVIQRGLAETQWPGRLQIVHQSDSQPTLLADCAHNADSAHRLAAALRDEYQYDRLWLLLGATADKDVSAILAELLPLAPGRTAVTQSSHPRAANPERLRAVAQELGDPSVTPYPDTAAALTAVWPQAAPGDLICVTGSIFIVGDLLNRWDALQSQLKMKHE